MEEPSSLLYENNFDGCWCDRLYLLHFLSWLSWSARVQDVLAVCYLFFSWYILKILFFQFHCKLNLVSCCNVFKNNSSVMSYYFPLNMLFKNVHLYLLWGLKCYTHCKDIQLYSGCLLKEHLRVLIVTIWFSVLIFVWFLIGCWNCIIIPVFMYNLAIDRWFQLPGFFVIVLHNLFHKSCDC